MAANIDNPAVLTARTPYQDTDNFAIGYGPAPNRPTYKGTLADLTAYMASRAGTGQTTLIGNNNYTMQSTDFELATSVGLTSPHTWTLVPANSLAVGQRRRVVDLAGVIGTYYIAVIPSGGNTINGLAQVVMVMRFAYLLLETDGVSDWTIVDRGPALSVSNNLSDLANVSAAINTLGIGTAALHNVIDFMVAANNLSELTNKAAARTKLALGPLAIQNTVLYAYLDSSMIATAADVANAVPNKIIPANVVLGARAPVAFAFATNINWDFNTFVNAEYSHNAPTTITASNVTPGQVGFIIFTNTKVGGYTPHVTWPVAFDFINAVTTLSPGYNQQDMLEYWTETTALIRCRLTRVI